MPGSQWFIDWFTSIPHNLQVLIGILGSIGSTFLSYKAVVAVSTRVINWWERRETRTELEEAFEEGSVELRPSRPERVFFPPELGVLDRSEYVLRFLKAKIEGQKFASERLSKTFSSSEAAADMAIYLAGDTRGLSALPDDVRQHIHLHVAKSRLMDAGADQNTINAIDERMSSLESNTLVQRLFGSQTLREVDCSPETPGGSDYFSKYFQPLMVAFTEDRFRRSAGEVTASTKDILESHLKNLAEHRVAAARYSTGSPPTPPEEVCKSLPRRVPRGPQKRSERRKAKKFNRKQAANSVVIVTEPDRLNAARRTEREIGNQLRKPRKQEIEYATWTPFLDWKDEEEPNILCFFWHEPQQSG